MKLSENLKNIRKENNLSQEQLAEKLGVSRQAVSKWESGQNYPEMDKVLLICKLFNYNIDELMNENVKEVEETKQSKINLNKYIEDFFNFITKTVDMLSAMTFKQKVKCLIEEIIISLFLVIIFGIIGSIGVVVLENLFNGISLHIYGIVRNIIQSLYIILALVVGITILLHIFKIRYLDYYEFVKEDDIEYKSEDKKEQITELSNKILLGKKKQNVIIRDPEHSGSKFLSGIIKIVLWCIKFMVACLAMYFAFMFICLVAVFVLSFLFVKAGLIFVGALIGIVSAIIIDFIILKLSYNFIISKKQQKSKIAILFVIALILAGVGAGIVSIGVTKFNYIDNPEVTNELEEVYDLQMTDNLSINGWNRNLTYIETDSNDVKIVVKHSKYNKPYMINNKETVDIDCYQDNSKVMEKIRQTIEDINNKEIKDYYNPILYVYTSKSNIEKLKQNRENKYNNSQEKRLEESLNTVNKLQKEISELKSKLREKEDVIDYLKQQN